MIFLLNPADEISHTNFSPAIKTIGYILLVLFAVIDLYGYRGSVIIVEQEGRWPYLVVLSAIALYIGTLVGVDALTLGPYIISFAFVVMSMRAGVAVTIASLFVAAMWFSRARDDAIAFIVIDLSVAAGLAMYRHFVISGEVDREEETAEQLRDERDRVARDVHDVLGHSLTVVVLKSELAGRLIDTDPERARAEVGEIERLARTALGEIRTTVGGLRATRLQDELDSAREALESAGIELDAPDDATIVSPQSRVTVAWTLRETTTNVLRHSDATKVDVQWGPDWIEVTDNGRGMGNAREGDGLTGLRERVAAVGGTLEIGPGPDGVGTRVKAMQP